MPFHIRILVLSLFFSSNVICDSPDIKKAQEAMLVMQGLTELYGSNTFSEKNVFNRTTKALNYVLKENWCGVIKNINNRGKQIYAHLYAGGKTYVHKLDADCIKYSVEYDDNKGIAVFIHGYRTKPSEDKNVISIGQSLMLEGTYNAIIFDASEFLNLSNLEYAIAVNQLEYLSHKLAEFLKNMKTHPSKIYLVGHSLGSHVAGMTGTFYERLTGCKIDRITGLDPAGPCFLQSSDDSRLTRDDADFVDIIHTNGDIFGISNVTGSHDFYPNGGSHQPGCTILSCSHVRALLFYMASFEPNIFTAVRCEQTTNIFAESKCKIKNKHLTTNVMGYFAKKTAPGVYFLKTGPVFPYGRGKYGLGIPEMVEMEGEAQDNEVE